MTTKSIKCRDCEIAAKTVSNPQDDDMVTCTQCGASDTYKNVMRLVGKQAQHHAAKVLQDSLKRSGGRNKGISYRPAKLNKPDAQFIIDFSA